MSEPPVVRALRHRHLWGRRTAPMSARWWLATLLIVAAGCGSAGQAPSSADPRTPSPNVSGLVDPPIPGRPADIVPPSSFPSTTSLPADPSTPASNPASVASPNGLTSVIVGPDALVGWWDKNRWVAGEGNFASVPARAGDRYKLLGLGLPVTSATGAAPRDDRCGAVAGHVDLLVPGLTRTFEGGHSAPRVAVSGIDNPIPRAVEILDPSSSVYRQAAAKMFAGLGIVDQAPQVLQAVRVDLEGDGNDEVIVVAEKLDPTLFARAGDYSIVFLRRVVEEKVVTTVIADSIARTGFAETPFVTSKRLATVADLNGDGRMEIVLSDQYYEGAGIEVYETASDGTPARVLSGSCGV
ncbi:MAG: hypothetical protein ACT4OM_02940 [Actinomycetota bacterium]